MRVLAIIIAVATGLMMLGFYFAEAFAPANALMPIENTILDWALTLAGMATLVGVLNLISAHGDKARRRGKGSIYSVLLMFSLLGAFLVGLISPLISALAPSQSNPSGLALNFLFESIILPSQAALMALLAITLLYAIIRLLRRRPNVMSLVFIASALIVLLGSATLPFGEIPILSDPIRPWWMRTISLGGARGLLIGVGLGTLVTGLRIILGVDRPYGEK